MPTYKNKKTGQLKYFNRVRDILQPDGSFKTVIPDDSTIDMTEWEHFDENPNHTYEAIRVSKSKTDGRGIR